MELAYERRGAGEPLVLLHPYGLRWQAWEPVLDMLAEHHDVIAVDLPGFGASPPLPHGTRYTAPAICDALEQFFATLELDRPHVAGNSLGGLIALELACRNTVRTATAIAPPGFYSLVQAARTAGLAVPGVVVAGMLPDRVQARVLRSALVSRVARALISARPDVINDAELLDHARAIRHAKAAVPLLRGIGVHAFFRGTPKVPVTFVWPTRDRIVTWRHAMRAAKALPEAHHVWLPRCGHVPMYDAPDRVTAAILEGTTARPRTEAA